MHTVEQVHDSHYTLVLLPEVSAISIIPDVSGSCLTWYSRILTDPLRPPGNKDIELRTTDGWKVMVDKTRLCQYSAFYQAAIYGEPRETKSVRFKLGINKACSEWFTEWLYTGKLVDRFPGPRADELFQLYVFAHGKDILALRRDVMTRLVRMRHDKLLYCEVALAVNPLPPSAPLYRWIIEWFSHHWVYRPDESGQQDRSFEVLPLGFLFRAMSGLARASSPSTDTHLFCACCDSPCDFHEHESYDEWLESKFVDPYHTKAWD